MQLTELVRQQQMNDFERKRDFKGREKAAQEMNAGQNYYMASQTQGNQNVGTEMYGAPNGQKMNQQQILPLSKAGGQDPLASMVGQQQQNNGLQQPYSIYAPRSAELSGQPQMHQPMMNQIQRQLPHDRRGADPHQSGANTELPAHFTQLLNNLQSRLDKLEERFQKVEMLNQSYMQRNFELSQENQELLKTKDSQKILEKIFLMFMNSFGNGGITNHDGIMSIFSQSMRQRELVAPPAVGAEGDRFENQSASMVSMRSQADADKYDGGKMKRTQATGFPSSRRIVKGSMLDQLSSSAEKQHDNTLGMDDLQYPQQVARPHNAEKTMLGEDRRDEYLKKLGMHNHDGLSQMAESMEPKQNQGYQRSQNPERQIDQSEQLVIRRASGPMDSQIAHGSQHPGANGRSQYFHEGELFGNKNDLRGFQNGNRSRERESPRSLIDDEADKFERNDQRDQFDNYLKFAGKRGKHQSAGSFNIQNFMKEMLFEFFNQKQEQLNSPKGFSPKGVEYNLPNLSGIGSLGLRDQNRFSADCTQMNNYKANIQSNQFKQWFQDQMSNYVNQNKNKQYLTYKEDNTEEQGVGKNSNNGQSEGRFDVKFKEPNAKYERSRGDFMNSQTYKNYQEHDDGSKGGGGMNHSNFFENQSEKNEFSSVTDLLNGQDQMNNRASRPHEYQQEEGAEQQYIRLQKSQPSHSPNTVYTRQRPREREAPTMGKKQEPIMLFDKTKYEELSSMAPSPKLQPNPHLDLVELEK